MPRYRVTATVLNVRSTPDSSSTANIVGKLPRGTKVESIAPPEGVTVPADWQFVQYQLHDEAQKQGFVARRFLIEIAPRPLSWQLGVNMREFAFFGTAAVPHCPPALQDVELAELKAMGVKVIRLFSTHCSLNTDGVINQLRTALIKIGVQGMKAILCLNDGLGSGFFPKGDEPFHNQTHGLVHKDYFRQKQYRINYLPQVKRVTEALADSPAILMWELGNEFAIHPQPPTQADADAFVAFAEETAELIKRATPRAFVSTGLVNTNHLAPSTANARDTLARKLYGLDAIDAVSIHYYRHDNEREKADFDAQIAQAVKKPFYIGEVGAYFIEGGRAGYLDGEIGGWKARGASMVLPWAFDTSRDDVGICDDLGFGRRFNDFDDKKAVLAKYR